MPGREDEGKEQYQKRLERMYTDQEEAYHAAYPDHPMPWTTGFLTGLFSRYGRGFALWAVVGALVAVSIWLVIAFFSR
ncbi:MAG: hypothetical protein IRY98_05195 [Alicyclobacillaceae bacterium]|nr:hypothetical protein [Alicyclobacillaceae bacterium]